MWKPKAPTRLSFFIWTATLGKILTVNNLQMRQVVVVDWWEDYWSLLLHCPVAQELWKMVCTLFGVHRVVLCVVVELLASWSSKFNRHKVKELWSMIPHSLNSEYRVSGGNGMGALLKGVKDWFTIWNFLYFRHCLSGKMLRVFLFLILCMI